MKRSVIHRHQQASTKSKNTHKRRPSAGAAQPSPPAVRDWEEALVASSARALGLALDPAWVASVKFNLQLILRHAALVDEFALPDQAEPAPVFHA